MTTIALIFAVLGFFGFMIGLVPCLGWFNWINIPFSFVGLVLSIAALAMRREPGDSPAGALVALGLSLAACFLGFLRLVLGGGIL